MAICINSSHYHSVGVFVRGRAARAGCGSASRVLALRVPLLGPVAFSVVTGPLAAGRGISTFPSLFMTQLCLGANELPWPFIRI